MRIVKLKTFADQLGIPLRTVYSWLQKDSQLGETRDGQLWIRLDMLAGRPGIPSLADALMLMEARWMRAVDLAKFSDIPRRTIAEWCRSRKGFGKRIDKIWYVDLDQLGMSEEQITAIRARSCKQEGV